MLAMNFLLKIIAAAGLIMTNHTIEAGVNLSPPEALQHANQLILVIAENWNSHTAVLQSFSRLSAQQAWHPVTDPWKVSIGRSGMAWAANLKSLQFPEPVKREGDGKSPAGAFSLSQAFGFASGDESIKFPYMAITSNTVCVDDPDSRYYGQLVDKANIPNKDWQSGESMLDQPKQYREGVVVNYNIDGKLPKGGSCIFLHIKEAEGKGTAGCTAMTSAQMGQILRWLDPQEQPVLVQLPRQVYEKLRVSWKLPELN